MSTQKIQVAIKASRAEVWAALTNPAMSPAYYLGFEVHIDPTPGSSYYYLSGGHQVITGTVIDAAEEEKLSMTFAGTWAPDVAELPQSTVSYTLGDSAMAVPGVTALTLVHEGLPDSASADNVEKGWVLILSGLKTLLETGSPLVAVPID